MRPALELRLCPTVGFRAAVDGGGVVDFKFQEAMRTQRMHIPAVDDYY